MPPPVIFVILSILLIRSPAVSRTGRDADSRLRLGEERHKAKDKREKTNGKDRMDRINRMTKMTCAAARSLAPAA